LNSENALDIGSQRQKVTRHEQSTKRKFLSVTPVQTPQCREMEWSKF